MPECAAVIVSNINISNGDDGITELVPRSKLSETKCKRVLENMKSIYAVSRSSQS